jgi:hypothetical protein
MSSLRLGEQRQRLFGGGRERVQISRPNPNDWDPAAGVTVDDAAHADPVATASCIFDELDNASLYQRGSGEDLEA